MVERPRFLAVSPHPDDEVYFWGGTIAKYVSEGADVHLLILSNGEKGRIAITEQEKGVVGSRRIEPSEAHWFAEIRQKECLQSAETLGIQPQNIEFAGLPDMGINENAIPIIQASIARIDPHIIISFDETGTSSPTHGDHSWAGIATLTAVQSLLKETNKFVSKRSFKRVLTYHLPRARDYLQEYASFEFPQDKLTIIDVSDVQRIKQRACAMYQSQMHLGNFFSQVGLLSVPQEFFYERVSLVPSCAGKQDVLFALDEQNSRLKVTGFPEHGFYLDSTMPNNYQVIYDRCQVASQKLLE